MVNAFVVMVVWIYQVVFSQHITVWMQCTSVLVLWEFSYPCYHCVLYIRCVACLHDGIWNFSLCIACHCRWKRSLVRWRVGRHLLLACCVPSNKQQLRLYRLQLLLMVEEEEVRYTCCRSSTHSLLHSLTHSLTHPFTHSPTHSFTHSFTHSPTHSLIYHTLPAAAVVQAPAIDPFDLIDPIDMLSKMPKDFYERIVSKPIITIL